MSGFIFFSPDFTKMINWNSGFRRIVFDLHLLRIMIQGDQIWILFE